MFSWSTRELIHGMFCTKRKVDGAAEVIEGAGKEEKEVEGWRVHVK